MTAALGALAGALLTAGLLCAVAAVYGPTGSATPRRARPPSSLQRQLTPLRLILVRHRLRAAAAAAACLGAWLFTGWPVAGIVAGASVLGLPALLASGRPAAHAIARLEALEEWTRRLADVLTVGVGLEQAIVASVRTAPPPVADHVAALAARLAARWPTEQSLRAFAHDLDESAGDLVAAALILGAHRRGPGLAQILDGLAATLAEEVVMRRKVEADRAKPRTTARWVTVITLAVVSLAMLNRTYVEPYSTGLGQLVLALLAVAFTAALLWMRAMTLGRPEPRFLAGTEKDDS